MYTMLVLTISGSVLALLLLCLRYTVLRKMPSTVYYYAWLLVLLRFALPLPGLVPTTGGTEDKVPAPSAPAVYAEMNDQENVRENIREDAQVYTQKVSDYESNNVTKSVPAESNESHIVLNATETQEMTVSETAPKTSLSIDWRSPKLWLSVWAIGAVISLAVTVLSYLKFSFDLKKNLMEPDYYTQTVYASIPGRKPALYFSDSARTPMMLGVFRPKIVLPYRDYDDELLNNILRHELTHYRRFDALYKWASVVVLSVHWFNPIAWFIRRELNRACEMSCDEMLLRSMDKDEKQSYGDSLLIMAASYALPASVVATSFATEKRNLKERLVQIMNYKKSGTRILAAALTVTLLAGSGVAAGPVYAKAEEAHAGGPDIEDVTETDPSESVTASASETEPSESVAGTDTETETNVSETENTSETTASAPKAAARVVKVKTVDEFLAAIAPNTVIELAEGVYDLSKASDYDKKSKNKYYSWEHDRGETGAAAELVIKKASGLTIRGAGMGKTTIAAVPRFVNVINFKECNNLTVSNLTAGHTKEPGLCTGGVLLIQDSSDINVESCGLFGCGTIGVHGLDCKRLYVTNCSIYECSVSAVSTTNCIDVLVSGCDVHDHGKKETPNYADSLFDVFDCTRFTVYNCKIHDNKAEGLLYTRGTNKDVLFLSNEVTKNTFTSGTFHFEQACATVDGCHFAGNNGSGWYKEYAKIKATGVDGKELDAAQFNAMKLRDIKPESVAPKATPTPIPAIKSKNVAPGTEINVKTMDEFLSAIGSDRTIVLDGANLITAQASDHYEIGGDNEFYHWCLTPDGSELIIHNVKNLTIKAKNSDPSATKFEAIPCEANVLSFACCENITLTGFTAGHTKNTGSSGGGVLSFAECKNIKVENMRLYGCGNEGIETDKCTGIDIINTEIFKCGQGAGFFTETDGIHFTNCKIHDAKSPTLLFYNPCNNRTWNGELLDPMKWCFDVKPDGSIVARDTYD